MAHIQINHERGGAIQMLINGVDFSMELFRDFEIVDHSGVVGLRVTFAVGRLDLDAETDVQLTDNVPAVAARVRSISEEVA